MEDKKKTGTIVHGIFASEHLDSSGEVLDIKGMDISSLGSADSVFNWEHNSKDNPQQVVGKVTFAKKIFKKSDCSNKHEEHFWDFCKKPFVYGKGELFDHPDLDHDGARNVAALLRYDNRDKGKKSRKLISFSVEGGKMDKKGMVVTKSIARDVAITIRHCNKMCILEILDDIKERKELYKREVEREMVKLAKSHSVTINSNSYRDLIIESLEKTLPSQKTFERSVDKFKNTNSFKEKQDKVADIGRLASKPMAKPEGSKPKREFTAESAPSTLKVGDRIKYDKPKMRTGKDIYNDPDTFKSEKNNMRKAIVAGMMGGSPDSKTGSDALCPGNVEPTLQKLTEDSKKTKKKIKKHEKLEKMSQGVFSNPNIGSEVDLRSDVKMVDPNKKYKMKSGKEVSQSELETKKIQNKYVQGEKRVSGAEKLSDFSKKDLKQIDKYKQDQFGSKIDPNSQKGVNIQDPEYGVNEAYEFKQSKPEGQSKIKGNYPSTKHHEATHKFFSSVAQKHGNEGADKLVNHLVNNYFDPEDIKAIQGNMSSNYGYGKDGHFQEETITHILDLIHDPEKRQDFHDKYSHMNSGKFSPRKAETMDRERMQRLKSGYNKAVKFTNSLNNKQLKQLLSKKDNL